MGLYSTEWERFKTSMVKGERCGDNDSSHNYLFIFALGTHRHQLPRQQSARPGYA